MTMKVSKEDLRRALCLAPDATLSTAQLIGNEVIFGYASTSMRTVSRDNASYIGAINTCISRRKELELIYEGSTDRRTFLPTRWISSYTVEGLDLDKEDVRRFSIDKITSMTYPI